jgi:hypothetical protein
MATPVARNANEAVVSPVAESVLGRSLESGGRVCIAAVGRNMASVAVKMFSLSFCFRKKFL